MKQVSQAIRDALWLGEEVRVYELYTLTLPSGVQRWTSNTANVTVGAETWSATAPVIQVPSGVSDVGLSVDARTVEMEGTHVIGGQTLQQLALSGAFDDAPFVWERAYVTAGPAIAKVVEFSGIVVDAQPRTAGARLRVKSRTADLEQEIPSRALQVSCPWHFGGPECGHTKLAGETCDRSTSATTGCQQWAGQIVNFGGFHQAPRSEVGSG